MSLFDRFIRPQPQEPSPLDRVAQVFIGALHWGYHNGNRPQSIGNAIGAALFRAVGYEVATQILDAAQVSARQAHDKAQQKAPIDGNETE